MRHHIAADVPVLLFLPLALFRLIPSPTLREVLRHLRYSTIRARTTAALDSSYSSEKNIQVNIGKSGIFLVPKVLATTISLNYS